MIGNINVTSFTQQNSSTTMSSHKKRLSRRMQQCIAVYIQANPHQKEPKWDQLNSELMGMQHFVERGDEFDVAFHVCYQYR